MTTTVKITGQLNGNRTLRNAIQYDELRDAGFGNYRLIFKTKKAAKKALWEAFKYLRSTIDEPNVGCIGDLRYSKFGTLAWDASTATIQ